MPSLIKYTADFWLYSTVCYLTTSSLLGRSLQRLCWIKHIQQSSHHLKIRHMIACRTYSNPRQTLGNIEECVKPDLTTTSSLLGRPLRYTKATILFKSLSIMYQTHVTICKLQYCILLCLFHSRLQHYVINHYKVLHALSVRFCNKTIKEIFIVYSNLILHQTMQAFSQIVLKPINSFYAMISIQTIIYRFLNVF